MMNLNPSVRMRPSRGLLQRMSLLLRLVIFMSLLSISLSGQISRASEATSLINLAHLRFLTEPISVNGRSMAIVHIYSEQPDYKWVDAAGEGISAVDDVARAAVVYLQEYERLKASNTSEANDVLNQARLCLEFVRYMQTEDGAFYNFVKDRNGTINTTGNTSYKSLDWWAMRALWALGEGVRVFESVDKTYADELTSSYLLTEKAIAGMITNYGDTTDLHGNKIPAWLPNGASDSSSVGLLGMVAYYRTRRNTATADLITKIAEGVAVYQLGNSQAYPFGMHPVSTNAPGYWHDWGAHQGQALVEAGMALDRQDWIDSAAKEANSFLIRHILLERFREIGVVPNRLGQIAYGTNTIVQTYMALYQATGDENYARLGGLAGSWLFGNNMAGVQMYDPATGRTFDGIEGPVAWRVNHNSGAESTIEGLLALQAIVDVPAAVPYLETKSVSGQSYQILEAEAGERISGEPFYYPGGWMGSSFISNGRYVGLGSNDVMQLSVKIPENGLYFVYVAHLRQTENQVGSTVPILRITTAIKLDGNLDEWDSIPEISSNTRNQFLRGVGFWKGPDVDSHNVRLSWDENNLYLAVDVRAPQHVQDFTLDNVWHGEATWVYLTDDLNRRNLSAKFTLAQTPDGPQIWDWVHSGFLKDVKLAWSKTETGFVYEAAVPWSSLKMAPKPEMNLGIEVGRSIGGNSFMDLTGRDPDISSNLQPAVLIDAQGDDAANTQSQEPIYLRVELGDEEPMLVATSVSPDSDYWWLDRVTRFPVRLAQGEYPLRYSYAGTNPDGLSKVDAFYIQPVKPQRQFQLADGRQISIMYDTTTNQITWNDSP